MSNYEFWEEIGNIFNAVVAYQEKSIEFNNRFITPWIRLGNVFDKQDRDSEAIKAYQKVIQLDPQNAQNWFELGNIYLRTESFRDASDAYHKAIELAPEFGWSYNNLGLILARQGKYAEAIPFYQKSLDLLADSKDRAVAWNRLGDAYRKSNEYERAVQAFQQADELEQEAKLSIESNAVVEDPAPADVRISEAAGESDPGPENLSAEGIPAISDMDAAHRSQTEVLAILLSAAENNLVDAQQAVDELESEISSAAEEAVVAVAASASPELATTETGDSAEIDQAESGMQIEPPIDPELDSEVALDVVGAPAPRSDRNTPSVHDAYNEFLKDSGEDLTALVPVAVEVADEPTLSLEIETPMTEGSIPEASKTSEDAINANSWNERGNAYYNVGAYDDAIVAYGKAIELDRQFAWPYSNLALVYAQKGRFAEAILFYKRSIELFNSDGDKAVSLNRLGNAYRKLNDYDNAARAYQEADRLDPHNVALSRQSRFSLLGSSNVGSKSTFAA